MKNQIYIEGKRLWNGKKQIPMVNSEIHYWRLEPSIWPIMLETAKEMGLETIAGYVQWHYHEYEEGVFDFEGKTDHKRNLVKWLELVKASGLNLIIRPGPYTFAEWDNYGVPDYAAKHHRLSSEFKAAAARYIAQVSAVIKPYLATNGGPIVMLQPDNMFDLGQYRFDRELGLMGGEGVFQKFLGERYDNIENLNAIWKTDYQDFNQTMAFMSMVHGDRSSLARYVDFTDFKHWYTKEAGAWTVNEYRQNGIDVPTLVNVTYDQDFEEMSTVLDMVGHNHYPGTYYGRYEDEHRFLMDELRLTPMFSKLPYVSELESGMWHGDHYFKGMPRPDHYRYMMLTVLASGAVAWSWYMFHDRDNWYMTPVSSRGSKRVELFPIFQKYIGLVKEHKPETWENCSPAAITYSQRHFTAHFYVPEFKEVYQTAKAFDKAGVDHTFYSLAYPGKAPKVLFYDGFDWLDAQAQSNLVKYIKEGGHLVVFQKFPTMDEHGVDCNLLEIPRPDGIDSQSYMTTFYLDYKVHLGEKDVELTLPDGVYWYHQVPGEPILASRGPTTDLNDAILQEYQFMAHQGCENDLIIGYHQKMDKGSLTVLGVAPTPELVVGLHEYLDVKIPSLPTTPGVQTVLYRQGECHYLFVINNGTEDKAAEILLDTSEFPGSSYLARDLLDHLNHGITTQPDGQRALYINVTKKSGTLLKITPN